MRIGYCSPFEPQKSGISDFSAELIVALKQYMDVVIFSNVEISDKAIIADFERHTVAALDNVQLRNSLDLIVYHVGNNYACHNEIIDMLEKYAGVVEIHDIGLHHMAAAKYLEKRDTDAYLKMVAFCHGEYGKRIAQRFLDSGGQAPWTSHPMELPMNRGVIESATGVVVHSELAKQMVLGVRPNVPISCIRLHSALIEENPNVWRDKCRIKLGLPHGKLIFGMFGFATPSKRVIPILDALKRYKDNRTVDFLYMIVGEVKGDLHIEEALKNRGLEDNVQITGFADLEDFKSYMGACDFCLNLRYSTQGESSASLHRMLGMGKPVILTDIGAFSEYPDEAVIKIGYGESEVDEIYNAICKLTSKQGLVMKQYGEAALKYAKEYCDIQENARLYSEFFKQMVCGIWQNEYEDTIITKLCELGLTDDDYLRHVWEKVKQLT